MTDADGLLERFLLALCVWREARGESPRGQQLVAETIMNRLRDDRWPASVSGVILQPKQFSAFNAGDPNATLFPRPGDLTWLSCVTVADAALADVPSTLANHYHTTAVMPAWADASKIVACEGHHVFYAL